MGLDPHGHIYRQTLRDTQRDKYFLLFPISLSDNGLSYLSYLSYLRHCDRSKPKLHLIVYTLRRDSSLHCISTSKAAIQLYIDSTKLIEMKIYSGVSCYF